MTAEISTGSTMDPSKATCDAPLVMGLPTQISAWLEREHEQFAQAIARAQRGPGALGEEPTVSIEGLPEATRRFLWRGIQKHNPALAELLRDPCIPEARTIFNASLHLYVADLLPILMASAPPCSQSPPALDPSVCARLASKPLPNNISEVSV